MNKKILFFAAVLMLSGCASIFSGTKENFVIQSEDKEAKLYLNDEYIGTGSAAATISKKKLANNITIRASKKGCQDTIRHVETQFNPTTLLGCFLDFCIVSVVAVDWLATGAVREASQTNYFITPQCEKKS